MKINNIWLYEKIRILLNGNLYKDVILRELKPQPTEAVLDVGCGTGYYSQVVKGKYIGVDINPYLINYANHIYSGTNKKFYASDLQTLIKLKIIKHADKAFIINVLHHLKDQEVISLLTSLKKITKKKIIIVDTDKGGANWFQRIFYLFDDGHYIRSQQELQSLIRKSLHIRNQYIFFPPSHTVRLCLFNCIP